MDWLIFFILGGWGSGWPRDPEDYWPKWCIACRLIIGGISAIIVNMLYPMDIGTGFMTAAVIWVAAWRAFFEPGDVVGVKLNPVGAPDVASCPEVFHEIIAGCERRT